MHAERPVGRLGGLEFQRVPEVKVVKNSVHVDLFTSDELTEAARIEAPGAERVWVSDDPEGSLHRSRRSGRERVLRRSGAGAKLGPTRSFE